jgi:hypothetical protein
MTGDQPCPINLLATQKIYANGNMATIAETIPINISQNPGVVENVFVGADCSPEEIQIYMDVFKEFCDVFAWSYEEIPGIDLKIVEHEIATYPDAKPVRQKIHPVNPKKASTINIEVDKLLKEGFIYPIHLTQWVSNPMPVNKKQGTICVCTDFHDLNKECPKDNFPTPFIDQIIDECAGCEAFYFMDMVFRDIIKSKSNLKTNIKQHSFVHGVHSHIVRCLLALKMLEPHSSRPCLFLFMTSSI